MPKRKNAPRVKIVVEFEINSPQPAEITTKMVKEMHEQLRTYVHYNIPDGDASSLGMRAAHIKTTRMIK